LFSVVSKTQSCEIPTVKRGKIKGDYSTNVQFEKSAGVLSKVSARALECLRSSANPVLTMLKGFSFLSHKLKWEEIMIPSTRPESPGEEPCKLK
jgi:hypothetical protein